ncbi:sigma-54-dependent transcriptional regulator [Oceanobacillus alkalisoli]|uniref:sigma-54-dependent transcriptional regulator n=1 Tax=Oceanobacillus alkalisoli TaxID=2925113 RepID=UPI001EE48F67|nr:sigma-54-dependent transcriptional regulator [Oceanobacillus alkalisoli]MCG5102565.1 PrpR N-terminal domain-containing protein [Oceanobacillus alkalisoli]
MKKIRILAIAPYKGLKELILNEAEKHTNWEIDVHIADMLEGMELVISLTKNTQYDFIISRAGTAELIREIIDIPVIDIKVSIIDMISAINLAKNHSRRFAIVGFKSITEQAETVKQLNGGSYDIKTLYSHTEISGYLHELKSRGTNLIICDVITSNKAKKLGFQTILVTSGKDSVLNSFEEIINLSRVLSYEKKRTSLINKIIQHVDSAIIALDNQRNLVYTNEQNIYSNFKVNLDALFQDLLQKRKCKVIKHRNYQVFLIRGELISLEEEEFAVFYIEEAKSTLHSTDPAITIINHSDTEQIDSKIMTTSNEQLNKILKDIKIYSKTSNPILITGEKGTGKDLLAQKLYMNGSFVENTFVIIDADYMNDIKWTKLFKEENSFLTMSNITIYMKNIHTMNPDCQRLVEYYFMNTHIHKRNKLIFSYISNYIENLQDGGLLPFIQNKLSSFQLVMPNLNERKADITSLTSLFISEFILKYGKQVLGIQPEALNLLEEFNWTYNIDQLERVIEECITLTDGYYIGEETVKRVLGNENITSHFHPDSIDLNKTLDEITKDVITLILSQENFNQTSAAKRLGISRSTLWRKMK